MFMHTQNQMPLAGQLDIHKYISMYIYIYIYIDLFIVYIYICIYIYLETPKPGKIKGSVIKPGFALQNQGLQFMHVSTPLADAFFLTEPSETLIVKECLG